MAVTKELDTPTQMTIHLATEAMAENKETVQKTIYKTKSSQSFDDKVKALGGSLKADLALTYAFLLDSNVEDPKVAKLTQPGLLKMIALRLTQLMPQFCFPCGGKLFYFKRGEEPLVDCRRCRRGACPECYNQDAVRQLTNFRYLCKECDEIVHDDMGEGRLLANDFDKTWAKKNPEKISAQENNDDQEKNSVKEKRTPEIVKETLQESAERPSQKDLFDESVEEIEREESEQEDEDSIMERQKNKKLLEKKRDVKKLKKKENNETKTKKKETVCPHLMKGRCHYGLSGRRHNKSKTDHDEKECRKEKMCECPFSHPLVCGKLLRNGRGRNGCREERECRKLHPQICSNSLRGVCHIIGCQLGLHIQGTNTKEAREKDKTERKEEKRGPGRRGAGGAGGRPVHQDPHLPAPGQPQALPRVLGQQQQQTAPTPAPAPAPASLPGLGQAGLNQETASFLGQLLLGELLRRMQQETSPRVEGRKEARVESRQEMTGLSLETLLRGLTMPQQN